LGKANLYNYAAGNDKRTERKDEDVRNATQKIK
jgi:hypothetical protein